MRPASAVVALSIAALLMAGCGVAFSSSPRANALFQSLEVTGRKTTGAPLTAALTYQQYLPIPVDVTCELRKGSEKVKAIGSETVPELPGGSPKKTPFPGNFSFDFTVDNPGSYRVKCYTTNDEDNTIIRTFTVRDAPSETATPPP